MPETTLTLRLKAKTQDIEKKVRKTQGVFKGFSDKVNKSLGRIVMTFGNVMGGLRALGRAFSNVVMAGVDFEYQMAKVSTMLYGQMDALDGLEQGVLDLSIQFGETTENLTNGLYQILSAQVAAKDSLEVLRVATKLAIGGFTDATAAAQTIVQVLKAYQLEADQAAAVAEVLARIQWKGITTVNQLTQSLGQVLTNSKQAGISFEELGAAITTATRAGLPTAEAITAINKAMLALAGPTERQTELFKELGIEADANGAKFKDFGHLLEMITNNSEVTNRAIKEIFGIRGQRAINAMRTAAKEFAKDLKVMRGEIAGNVSILQFMFERMETTTWMAIRRFKASIRAFIIKGMKDALPTLKAAFNYLTTMFKQLDPKGIGSFMEGIIILGVKILNILEKIIFYVNYIVRTLAIKFKVVGQLFAEGKWMDALASLFGSTEDAIERLYQYGQKKGKKALWNAAVAMMQAQQSLRNNLNRGLSQAEKRWQDFISGNLEHLDRAEQDVYKKIDYGPIPLAKKRLSEAKQSAKELKVEVENAIAKLKLSGMTQFEIMAKSIATYKEFLKLLKEEYPASIKIQTEVMKKLAALQLKFTLTREREAKKAFNNEMRRIKMLTDDEEKLTMLKIASIRKWIKEFKHGGEQYKLMYAELMKLEKDLAIIRREGQIKQMEDQLAWLEVIDAHEIEKAKTRVSYYKKMMDKFKHSEEEFRKYYFKAKKAELELDKLIAEQKKKILEQHQTEKMKKLKEDIEAYKARARLLIGDEKKYQRIMGDVRKGEAQLAKAQLRQAINTSKRMKGMSDEEHYRNLERAKIQAEDVMKNAKLTKKEKAAVKKFMDKMDKEREELLKKQSKEEQERWKDDEQLADEMREMDLSETEKRWQENEKLRQQQEGILEEIAKKMADVKGRMVSMWEELMTKMYEKGSGFVDKMKEKLGELGKALGLPEGGIGEWMKTAGEMAKKLGEGPKGKTPEEDVAKKLKDAEQRNLELSDEIQAKGIELAQLRKKIEELKAIWRKKGTPEDMLEASVIDIITAKREEKKLQAELTKLQQEAQTRKQQLEDIKKLLADKQGDINLKIDKIIIERIDDALEARETARDVAGYVVDEIQQRMRT